jgi:hypothetical protein
VICLTFLKEGDASAVDYHQDKHGMWIRIRQIVLVSSRVALSVAVTGESQYGCMPDIRTFSFNQAITDISIFFLKYINM